MKVLVPDVHLRNLDVERSVTEEQVEYLVFDETDPAKIPDHVWHDCDAILLWNRMHIRAPTVAKLGRCKLIVRVGVGFDIVDVEACRQRGIPVSNVPDYGTTEVADHALALLLSLVRGIGTYENRLKANLATGFMSENVPVVRRLRDTTFGAVGMGRIGTAIARRAAGFDMKVIYFDPFLPSGHELGLGLERVETMDALLARSDVVSLHVPLSDATRNLMGAAEFGRMRPGSIFINIARGGLVDMDALHDALSSGHLAAAGLDVLPKEPPVPAPRLIAEWAENAPWLAGRLVVTPHSAFYSEAGYTDMQVFSAKILKDYLFDGKLRNNVNPGWQDHVPDHVSAALDISPTAQRAAALA